MTARHVDTRSPFEDVGSLLDRPIIIIGCNRSGTTLLFRNLSEHPATWSLYVEGRSLFYRYFSVDPEAGDRIREAAPEKARSLVTDLYDGVHNKEYFRDRPLLGKIPRKMIQQPLNRVYKRPPLRLVEKTPSNCFRVPLLARLFPDARFLFLVRRPEATISSLMEGWKNWSGVVDDAEWRYGAWHYLVPPGWTRMRGRPLAEICAFQWTTANRTAWADLKRLRGDDFLMLRHERLLADPRTEYSRILEFCQLPPSRSFDRVIGDISSRIFTTGGTSPRPDKWRSLHGDEIESVRAEFEPLKRELYGEVEAER